MNIRELNTGLNDWATDVRGISCARHGRVSSSGHMVRK